MGQAFLPVIDPGKRTGLTTLAGLSHWEPRWNGLSYLLKATQGLRFIVIRVKHGEELRNHQKVLNLLREVQ